MTSRAANYEWTCKSTFISYNVLCIVTVHVAFTPRQGGSMAGFRRKDNRNTPAVELCLQQ